ncbi:MAG: L-threonine aldolase [Alphaproteobacteria bacterium]|nr:L-threonine aldolase [Alphaproteobacteria bacterium]
MNFCSDNTAGVHPQILDAIARVNSIPNVMPYGNDEITKGVGARLNEIFEREVEFFAVATGTAANSLALAALSPPWGAVFCHELAHIQQDECGAPEFFTGGAKLMPLPGADGKLQAAALDGALQGAGAGVVHHVQPAAVSLTQASECGTVYGASEVGAIGEICRKHKVGLHMDGARFANALSGLNVSAADITWRAGVDVLSFGATKNGAMAAEAIVVFDKALAATMAFRRKRAGHLFSKMRFLTTQLDAYLSDGLWLKSAAHSNAMARRLADGLQALKGVRLLYKVQANEIFPVMPLAMKSRLEAAGFSFYEWPTPEARAGEIALRLVTSFSTDPAHVEKFLAVAGAVARGEAA